MLRFKQFLLIENATITAIQHLEDIYGKEKADEMIASIREREREKGSAEDYANYAKAYNDSAVKDEKRMRELAAQFNIDIDTEKTGDRFAIPIYSDKNLNKPITIEPKDSKNMMSPKYNFVASAMTHPRGEPIPTEWSKNDGLNPIIQFNKDIPFDERNPDTQINMYLDNPSQFSKHVAGRKHFGWPTRSDILGHEITHTLQPNYWYPDMEPTKTEYNSDKKSDEKDIERKKYTQNAHEPAARFSELKHGYFKSTGKLLKANMTADELKDFKAWQQNPENGMDQKDMNDTMQLLDTPEGEELFRRTAKANQTSRSAENQTRIA